MKHKRIAYMVRGDFRESDIVFYYLREYNEIFKKNGIIVDFFYFGWDSQQTFAYSDEYSKFELSTAYKYFSEYGLNLISAKIAREPDLRINGRSGKNDSYMAQSYQSYEINKMRREHMMNNDIEYDIIILSRFDQIFNIGYIDKLTENLLNGKLNDDLYWIISSNIHTLYDGSRGGLGCFDYFFIGDESGMNTFCHAYESWYSIDKLYEYFIGSGLFPSYLFKRKLLQPTAMINASENISISVRRGIDRKIFFNKKLSPKHRYYCVVIAEKKFDKERAKWMERNRIEEWSNENINRNNR